MFRFKSFFRGPYYTLNECDTNNLHFFQTIGRLYMVVEKWNMLFSILRILMRYISSSTTFIFKPKVDN